MARRDPVMNADMVDAIVSARVWLRQRDQMKEVRSASHAMRFGIARARGAKNQQKQI